jgi:RimJ/RimL family protein N-acetyltransferase
MSVVRCRIAWPDPSGELLAIEPTTAEVAASAAALAAAYSDPHNAPLMGHVDPLSPADVIEHYAGLADEGGRPFLLYDRGELAGDADFRGLAPGPDGPTAEFAIMVAARAAQGKGLGTRFALMLHRFAFAPPPLGLGLGRIYVAIVPQNAGSRRLFAKLGYRADHSPTARIYVDEEDDLSLSLGAAEFARDHGAKVAAVELTARA